MPPCLPFSEAVTSPSDAVTCEIVVGQPDLQEPGTCSRGGAVSLPSRPGATRQSQTLLWEINAQEPTILSLTLPQEPSASESCTVQFGQPLLQACCLISNPEDSRTALCVATTNWLFYAITLHETSAAFGAAWHLLANSSGREVQPEIRQLADGDFGDTQRQGGDPTCMAANADTLLVGSTLGAVACAAVSLSSEVPCLEEGPDLRPKGRRLSLFRAQTPAVVDLAPLGSGPLVCALYSDCMLRIWDTSTCQQDVSLEALQDSSFRIWGMSTDGKVGAASSSQHSVSVRVHEAEMQELLAGSEALVLAHDEVWNQLQRQLAKRSSGKQRNRLVQAAAGLAAEQGCMAAVREICSVYMDTWSRLHPPLAFLPPCGPQGEPVPLGFVRQGLLTGLLVPLRGGLQPLQRSESGRHSKSRKDLQSPHTAAQHIAKFLGPLTLRMASTCLSAPGTDPAAALLPAMIEALSLGPVRQQQGSSGAGGRGPSLVARKRAVERWREARVHLGLDVDSLMGSTADPLKAIACMAESITRLTAASGQDAGREDVCWSSPAACLAAVRAMALAQSTAALQGLLLAAFIAHARVLGSWALSAADMAALAQGVVPQMECQLRSAAIWQYLSSQTSTTPERDLGDPVSLLKRLRLGAQGSQSQLEGAAASEQISYSESAKVGRGSLLEAILPVLLPMHRRRPSRALVLAALGPGARARPDLPLKALQEQVLRLAEALFNAQQLAAIPHLLTIAGPSVDCPGLRFLQGFAMLHEAAGSRKSPPAPSAAAAVQALFEAASALREPAAESEQDTGGFGSPIDGRSAESGWGRGPMTVTDRGVLRRAVQHLCISATGRYDYEGPEAEELQYFEALMLLCEQLGLPSCAREFATAALHAVDRAFPEGQQPDEHDINMASPSGDGGEDDLVDDAAMRPEPAAAKRMLRRGRLWGNLFAYALEDGRYEEAYSAAGANPVAERQLQCLEALVTALASHQDRIATLCRLPFSGAVTTVRDGRHKAVSLLATALQTLQRRAASCALHANPQPYQVLYSFCAARGDWRGAAAAQLALARRLQAEGSSSILFLCDCLGAAVNALSLVAAPYAWLDNHPYSPSAPSSVSEEPGTPTENHEAVLTLDSLRREHARACAGVALGLSGPDACRRRSEGQLLQQLLAKSCFEAAIVLADAVLKGPALSKAQAANLDALAKHCAAPVTTAQQGWELLQTHLQRMVASPCNGAGLPEQVAEAVLAAEDQSQLPCWLQAYFQASPDAKLGGMAGGLADPAALLRLYLAHGRLQNAAQLAIQHLTSWQKQALDVQRQTHCASWFPASLLAGLYAQLTATHGQQALAERLGMCLETHLQESAFASREILMRS
ncbi:hypothetical protein WJX73_000064 [Symbiochloris irregularis]|uniref:NUP160 middle TPR domain-containing protein n=1 Tax=Symbiochloris irregularis TaxID=706552 RepID=A0AAW1NTA1_9CHLO